MNNVRSERKIRYQRAAAETKTAISTRSISDEFEKRVEVFMFKIESVIFIIFILCFFFFMRKVSAVDWYGSHAHAQRGDLRCLTGGWVCGKIYWLPSTWRSLSQRIATTGTRLFIGRRFGLICVCWVVYGTWFGAVPHLN